MIAPGATISRSKINWTALREQVDAAQALLVQRSSPTGEGRRAILRERARIAAMEPDKPELAGTLMELVEFSLFHETYGIETAYVREVAYLDRYLPLPGAEDFILGVVPLRGRMLTIINLNPFFELPAKGLTNLNKVIVLENSSTEFGLLVDSVSGSLRHVAERTVQPLPPTFTGPRAQFSRGITPDSLVVLDARRLLDDPRFNAQPGPLNLFSPPPSTSSPHPL